MYILIGIIITLITLPCTLELLILTLGSLIPFKNKKNPHCTSKKTAIIIPAHNEEEGIQETIQSVKQCKGAFDVYVVADNCTDQTAEITRKCQVNVIERKNPHHKGKSKALDEAFNKLLGLEYQYFVVIDADTYVSENCIEEIQSVLDGSAEAVQVKYSIRNPEESWRSRLMSIAFMATNHLRTRGRAGLGLSVGIHGNGFALKRETLLQVPYRVDSLVEDLAYHLELVKQGKKVRYIETSAVLSDMPTTGAKALNQRARWEGGRLRLMLDQSGNIAKEVFKGSFRLIEPLLDLLSLPLSYQVILLLLLLCLPVIFFRLYAFIALLIIALHVSLALLLGGGKAADFLYLFTVPFYLVWKALIFFKIVNASKPGAEWIRTQRK